MSNSFWKNTYQKCNSTVHKKCFNLTSAFCAGNNNQAKDNNHLNPLSIDMPHDFRSQEFLSFNINMNLFPGHLMLLFSFVIMMVWWYFPKDTNAKLASKYFNLTKWCLIFHCRLVAHKKCIKMFPNNCGLDEKKFGQMLNLLNVCTNQDSSNLDQGDWEFEKFLNMYKHKRSWWRWLQSWGASQRNSKHER